MKSHIIFCIILLSLLTACSNSNESTNELFSEVYSEDNILLQSFTIYSDKDTVLKGKAGTLITIPKQTFVDSLGNPVAGQIQIELKEVFSFIDMVLGNLTTTSNKKPLQTGGMIYINARSEGKQLAIADDKKLDVKISTNKAQEGMQVYEGVRDSLGINWKNPVALNQPAQKKTKAKNTSDVTQIEKKTNLMYRVEDKNENQVKQYPPEIDDMVSDIAWQGDGLKLTKDSSFMVDSFVVILVKQRKIFKDIIYQETPKKGKNTFTEDQNISYLFSMKKLGWANIDRLYKDPRSKEIELITIIDNQSDFETIYTTMVTEQMFLPGYQMENNSFSFTHSDDEKPVLPIGATATIMATAYKNNNPYFCIRQIKIDQQQTVALHLVETTKEDLKKQLQKNL